MFLRLLSRHMRFPTGWAWNLFIKGGVSVAMSAESYTNFLFFLFSFSSCIWHPNQAFYQKREPHCPAPLTFVPPAGGDSGSCSREQEGELRKGVKVHCSFSLPVNPTKRRQVCSLPPNRQALMPTHISSHGWNTVVKHVGPSLITWFKPCFITCQHKDLSRIASFSKNKQVQTGHLLKLVQ